MSDKKEQALYKIVVQEFTSEIVVNDNGVYVMASLPKFEKDVSDLLKQGYVLHGPPFLDNYYMYNQALYKLVSEN